MKRISSEFRFVPGHKKQFNITLKLYFVIKFYFVCKQVKVLYMG